MDNQIKFTGDFYAKSPEEFKQIKIAALKAGYKGVEMSNGPREGKSGRGQFLTLEEPVYVRKGKCGYCKSLIDIRGIYSHNRKCEVCNKTVSKNYEVGDLITFFFRTHNDIFSDITLRIHSMDEANHIMRFDSIIPRQGKYRKQDRKRVLETLDKNKDAYTKIKMGKKEVYCFYYTFNGGLNELMKINTSETRGKKGGSGGFKKCSVVQILNGVEYSEWDSFSGFSDKLPMPTTFHIYRDWKVEKTIKELCHRSNIVSRPEYYSGRSAGDITSTQLAKLHSLIKEFKGLEASDAFVDMIEGTSDFSATNLVKRILKLDAQKYKWTKEDSTEKENNIEIDGSVANGYATILSVLNSPVGGMFSKRVFGDELGDIIDEIGGKARDYQSLMIKNEVLSLIQNDKGNKNK